MRFSNNLEWDLPSRLFRNFVRESATKMSIKWEKVNQDILLLQCSSSRIFHRSEIVWLVIRKILVIQRFSSPRMIDEWCNVGMKSFVLVHLEWESPKHRVNIYFHSKFVELVEFFHSVLNPTRINWHRFFLFISFHLLLACRHSFFNLK